MVVRKDRDGCYARRPEHAIWREHDCCAAGRGFV